MVNFSSASNPIVIENAKTGNPATEWDISGAGDNSIQGFATEISVNPGETVRFKIKTDATSYRLDIYRLGYYDGMGARKVAPSVLVSRAQSQSQPDCIIDQATGLIDCGNWSVSASWNVPIDATSGIYFAKVIRPDTQGASHIVFIVRDDDSSSALLFQTSDTTWQAYNNYGGNSLYAGSPGNPSRAYKVSYNRPFNTRAVDNGQDWLFSAEYPMVRWLEANGYDVSYFTGVDSDRRGHLIRNHQVFLSIGHDEYWSSTQRANVEAARDAGVHLAFLSGNEVFWKIRWENSVDTSPTPYRTLVCYKQTFKDADPNAVDPQEPPTWTGTWRDPRCHSLSDCNRPENALTGTLFTVNDGATTAITVSAEDGKMRFWRNTDIANLPPGSMATLSDRTLGYEWDEDKDNGFRPPGLIHLSTTVVENAPVLQDYGTTFAPATATHHLTLYKHRSGAIVFGAGTVQWSWGLDGNHDRGNSSADLRMQQATVNLLADMGVQPATLRVQQGLVPATASTDTIAPTSTITSPTAGTTVQSGSSIIIRGTATDAGGGVVGGVEVSIDGGTTWHPAKGRAEWSYTWTPTTSGTITIKSRAIDDSGNLETPGAGITVTVGARTCPCSIWDAATAPAIESDPDNEAVELGVKFQTERDGFITGIRFYKGIANTGTHTGTLWSSTGQELATATFMNETASGWQQVNFDTPARVTANTVYVASYHTQVGRYAATSDAFTAGVSAPPLRILRNGEEGGNGVYKYGAHGFPTDTYQSSNYWVDVVFVTGSPDIIPPTIISTTPTHQATNISPETGITITFSEPINSTTLNSSTVELWDAANTIIPTTITYNAATRTATLKPNNPLANAATYTVQVKGQTSPRIEDLSGNGLSASLTWSFSTTATTTQTDLSPSIWSNSTIPAVIADADTSPIEVGVKFRSQVNGFITGIRFYKAATNTGTHVGTLWTISGQELATATFTNETTSGWQQVNFATPVPIVSNTVYVASYHTTVGHYSIDEGYFAASSVESFPLRALRDGDNGGNGVYKYGTRSFPTDTYRSSNYWIDVMFNTSASTSLEIHNLTANSPGAGVLRASWDAIAGAIHYGCAWSKDNKNTWNGYIEVTTNSVQFIGLSEGDYFVRVYVHTASGDSGFVELNLAVHVNAEATPRATEPAFKRVVVIPGTGVADGVETNPLMMADPTTDTPIGDGSVFTNDQVPNNYLQLGLQFKVLKPVKFCGCRLWLPAEEVAVSNRKTVWLWDLKTKAKVADIVTPVLVQGWNQIHLRDADQIVLPSGDYIISTVFRSAYPARQNLYQNPIAIGDFAQAITGIFDDANNKPNGVIPSMTFKSSSYYVDVLLKSTGASVSVNVREHVENYPIFKENFKLDNVITDFLVNGSYLNDRVMAYTDKESVNVGETLNIKGSAKFPGNVKIEIIRVGYYGGYGGKVVDTAIVPFTDQTSNETLTAPDTVITIPLVKRCQWNTVYSYTVPPDAITGVYYIRLTCIEGDNNGARNYAFFVVRNDAIAGDILVKINTNSYAAYNKYGGSSFYGNLTPKVSKDRPTGSWSEINNIQRWELCTIFWLERMGYRVSYCTDQDIDEKGEAYLRQFKVHLSSGHDEYWTKKQYEAVFNAVNHSLNVVLLAANAAYWLGRYEDNRRTYCVYKNSVKWFDPSTTLITDLLGPTCRPRDSLLLKSSIENPNNRYPETKLWGVMYTNDDAAQGYDYRINANRVETYALPANVVYSGLSDPLFEGTGFKDGDTLPNCAGYEVDHIANDWMPEIKNGTQFRILNECGYTDVLQPGILEPNWGDGWRSNPTNDGWTWTGITQDTHPPGCNENLWLVGQTVYFERPSGTKCFASGHINTPYCLAPSYMREINASGAPKESDAFGRLLQNVLTSMAVWGAYRPFEIVEGSDLPDLIAEGGASLAPHTPTGVTVSSSGSGILDGTCAVTVDATQYRWQYSKDGAEFTGDRLTTNTVQWFGLDAGNYRIQVQAINMGGASTYSAPSTAVNISIMTQALFRLEAGMTFTLTGSGEYQNEHRYKIKEKKPDGSMVVIDETKQLERAWSAEVVNSYLFVEITDY